MRGRRRCAQAAQVPTVLIGLAAEIIVFGTSSCQHDGEACYAPDSIDASNTPVRAASLLQHHHRHHRSQASHHAHAPSSADAAGIFQQFFADTSDKSCTAGSSCTAGGIPPSRGACVAQATTENECWDICNIAHSPQDYRTGDAAFEAKLEAAVKGVRAGSYPHMRCPTNLMVTSESSQAETAEARDAHTILAVMDSIKAAEKAAETARLLTSAAKREAAAVGEGNAEAAAVMRLAADAEKDAAEKAKKAAGGLKELSEIRKAKAAAEEADLQAKKAEAYWKEEDAAAKATEEVELKGEADKELKLAQQTQPNGTDANTTSGCCFSFGFASEMEPCCLSTQQTDDYQQCAEEADLVGGKTGFTLAGCPNTAAEAALMLAAHEEEDAVVPSEGNNSEPLVGENASTEAESLEKLQKKIDETLQEDKRVADAKEVAAEEMMAKQLAKEKETLANETQESLLEAKRAATEAKRALLDACKAELAVKNDLLGKRQLEYKVCHDKAEEIKRDVESYEDAIKQAKALGQVRAVADVTQNLTAGALTRMAEAELSEKAEQTAKEALEAAQAETEAAFAAVQAATAQAEMAEQNEEDVKNGLGGSGSGGLGGDDMETGSDNADIVGSQIITPRCIIKACGAAGSHQDLLNWGRGESNPQQLPVEPVIGELTTRSCTWKPEPECLAPFSYQGVTYDSCREVEAEKEAWCSLDTVYVGRWMSCSKVCEDVSSQALVEDNMKLQAQENSKQKLA